MKPELLVDFVADFVCPWCHVGFAALERAAATLESDFALRIRFRPFQLSPETPAAGVDRADYYARKFPDPAVLAAGRERIRAMAQDMEMNFDASLPTRLPNTLIAHQAVALAYPGGRQRDFVRAVYDAYWSGRADLSSVEDFRGIADGIGMDGAVLARLLASGAARDEVASEIEAFRRAGVSGVPTTIVGERIGFSGALPAETMAAALRDAAARLA
ncbi:MAG: DsbA family oxidoreductase [Parvularculaceae bacterium]|nr:DsbA family oxidoreductase [Parvularculaceae bacterium]